MLSPSHTRTPESAARRYQGRRNSPAAGSPRCAFSWRPLLQGSEGAQDGSTTHYLVIQPQEAGVGVATVVVLAVCAESQAQVNLSAAVVVMIGRMSSAQRILQLTHGARDMLDTHISSTRTDLRPAETLAPAPCRGSLAGAPTAGAPTLSNRGELIALDFHRGGDFSLSLSSSDGVTCVGIHSADGSEGGNRLASASQPCVGWTLVLIAGETPRWSTPALVLAQIQLAPAGPVPLTWRTNGIEQPKVEKTPLSPLDFHAARVALSRTLGSELRLATPPSPQQFDDAVEKLRRPPNEHACNSPTKSLSAVLARSVGSSPEHKAHADPP